jgi:hypothetical protein
MVVVAAAGHLLSVRMVLQQRVAVTVEQEQHQLLAVLVSPTQGEVAAAASQVTRQEVEGLAAAAMALLAQLPQTRLARQTLEAVAVAVALPALTWLEKLAARES